MFRYWLMPPLAFLGLLLSLVWIPADVSNLTEAFAALWVWVKFISTGIYSVLIADYKWVGTLGLLLFSWIIYRFLYSLRHKLTVLESVLTLELTGEKGKRTHLRRISKIRVNSPRANTFFWACRADNGGRVPKAQLKQEHYHYGKDGKQRTKLELKTFTDPLGEGGYEVYNQTPSPKGNFGFYLRYALLPDFLVFWLHKKKPHWKAVLVREVNATLVDDYNNTDDPRYKMHSITGPSQRIVFHIKFAQTEPKIDSMQAVFIDSNSSYGHALDIEKEEDSPATYSVKMKKFPRGRMVVSWQWPD